METNILIVDDEAAIADLVEVYLKNEGYTVHKFGRAGDALACVASTPLDLAILDVMLPDMDGFTLCQKIREEHLFPILMLTARVEDMDKIMGLTLGADDYLVKPFRQEEVDRALDWCLEYMPEPLRSLSVYAEREPQEFPLASVLYIEVLGHQSHIHTLRQTVVVRKSLDDLERAVDSPDFFRCHRSFLVNLGHVERIESSDFLMSDGARIPISSPNLPRARNAFLDWVYLRAWESK